MKKMMIGLFSATLMGAGLVGVSTAPAQAACPYTGCVDTFTRVSAPDTVERGERARICAKVTTGGNGRPKGRVTLDVQRSRGGFHFIDTKTYDAPRTCFSTPKLRKLGKYVINMRFDRRPGSGFKDSDQTDEFRVVR